MDNISPEQVEVVDTSNKKLIMYVIAGVVLLVIVSLIYGWFLFFSGNVFELRPGFDEEIVEGESRVFEDVVVTALTSRIKVDSLFRYKEWEWVGEKGFGGSEERERIRERILELDQDFVERKNWDMTFLLKMGYVNEEEGIIWYTMPVDESCKSTYDGVYCDNEKIRFYNKNTDSVGVVFEGYRYPDLVYFDQENNLVWTRMTGDKHVFFEFNEPHSILDTAHIEKSKFNDKTLVVYNSDSGSLRIKNVATEEESFCKISDESVNTYLQDTDPTRGGITMWEKNVFLSPNGQNIVFYDENQQEIILGETNDLSKSENCLDSLTTITLPTSPVLEEFPYIRFEANWYDNSRYFGLDDWSHNGDFLLYDFENEELLFLGATAAYGDTKQDEQTEYFGFEENVEMEPKVKIGEKIYERTFSLEGENEKEELRDIFLVNNKGDQVSLGLYPDPVYWWGYMHKELKDIVVVLSFQQGSHFGDTNMIQLLKFKSGGLPD